MTCVQARETLWPPEHPTSTGPQVALAWSHIAACDACRDFFGQDRALLEAWDRLRARSAPPGLRERVMARIAAQDRALPTSVKSDLPPAAGPRRALRVSTRFAVMLAAVAGVSLAASVTLLRPHAGVPVGAGMFVDDYLRRAVSEDRIDSSDRSEIARFLARELGTSIAPLDGPDIAITGAEICLLDGRRGAMIRYIIGGQPVAHYIVPGASPDAGYPATETRDGEGRDSPTTVVTWVSHSANQALIGPLPASRLIAIALTERSP